MSTQEILEEVRKVAKQDNDFRIKLLNTENMSNPVTEFCKVCQEAGYEIYAIDLINAGEEAYAAMRRSTNGGGENSPLLLGEDDLYAMFLEELR